MKEYSTPYELNGQIPLRHAIPLGLQHVLAMFVGNLSPLLIIMSTCGMTDVNGFGSSLAVQTYMPQWLRYIFGGSGIVPSAVIAILLNILLPRDEMA